MGRRKIGFYDQVVINGVTGMQREITNSGTSIWFCDWEYIANRQRVIFENDLSENNSNSLLISKVLEEGAENDGTEFEFRVLMENVTGELVAYSNGTYYVRSGSGENVQYYEYNNGWIPWTAQAGETDPPAYRTGGYGTVRIPAGLTVEIPQLLVGTAFYVDEIRVPEKWALESKVYTEDSCSDPDPAVSGEAWDYSTNSNRVFSAEKQIAFGKDAEVTFTNRLNTTSVAVRKVWNDENNKDGIRPASIQVQLKADGNAKGDPVTLNGSETPVPWAYTWSDVPEKDGERTIVYTVDETAVPAYYEKEIDGDAAEGFIITNTHVPETVNISGTKIWNDSGNGAGSPIIGIVY